MATGLEMMLGNMLRGMGLNPEEIGKLATGMGEGLTAMLESQARIERKLDRLLRQNDCLTIEGTDDDGADGSGTGNGDGGNPGGNGDGGTDAGSGGATG